MNARPGEPVTESPSKVGAKYDERTATPEACAPAPAPASPASLTVMFRTVVEASVKYMRRPTLVHPSMSTSSNHAPVALISTAASAMFGVLAPGPPVPVTVNPVMSADS